MANKGDNFDDQDKHVQAKLLRKSKERVNLEVEIVLFINYQNCLKTTQMH